MRNNDIEKAQDLAGRFVRESPAFSVVKVTDPTKLMLASLLIELRELRKEIAEMKELLK